jgi:hypothetical protein
MIRDLLLLSFSLTIGKPVDSSQKIIILTIISINYVHKMIDTVTLPWPISSITLSFTGLEKSIELRTYYYHATPYLAPEYNFSSTHENKIDPSPITSPIIIHGEAKKKKRGPLFCNFITRSS